MSNRRNMRKIRNCVSCITTEQCENFRKASKSVQPINEPICKRMDTHNVVKIGSQSMKEDGFVLTRGIENV